MRWSKHILSFGILPAIMLTGCRKESSSDNPKPNPAPLVQTKSDNQGPMQSRETQIQRPDDGNKVVIATPKQCYADLCEASHELSLLELMSNAEKGSQAQKEYYAKYINPLVLEAMKQRAASARAMIATIEKHKNQFENLKMTAGQRRFLTVMYYLFKPQVLEPEDRVRIEKAFKDLPLAKILSEASIRGAKSYLQMLHPNLDIQKAAHAEAKYISTIQKSFNDFTELKIINISSLAQEQALKGELLDETKINDIVNRGAYMRRLEAMLIGPVKDAIDKIGYTEENFFHTYKSGKIEKHYKDVKDYLPRDAAKCETSFYQSINLAPKKAEIEKFEDIKNQVKKASLNLLTSSDPAYAIVEKTDFYLPYTSEETVGQWTDSFNEEIRSQKGAQARAEGFGVSETYIMAVVNALTLSSDKSLCDGTYNPDLIDAINPEYGASRLSWMTVRYPQYGISVVAHELAHVIFKYSKNFETEKQCIISENKSDKYTSEDFADMIAIRAEAQLEKSGVNLTGKKANVGCLFASLRIGEGLTNTTPEDDHSSHLFRAVKFALYRKQDLPASCKALARVEKSNVLNSCDN